MHLSAFSVGGRFVWIGTLVALILFMLPRGLHAQEEDWDAYRLRLSADWIYSSPSGNIQGSNDAVSVDISKTLQFQDYSTYDAKGDWKFTRKNHLYFAVVRFDQSRQTVLNQSIVFQGQPFTVGLTTQAALNFDIYAPGYQYDILRRKRGHLGIAVQLNVSNTTGTISEIAQVNGVPQIVRTARGSLLAPVPVVGPEFRFYLTRRLFVDGSALGMYFGGYGDSVTSRGTLGLALNRNIRIHGGYALAQRLTINNKSSTRIGVRLTQQGALAGLEFSF